MASNGMNTFSATECIKFGWETFKKRPWFLIGVYVLIYAIELIPGIVADYTQGGANVLLNIISFVFSALAWMVMISFFLRAHDDIEHVSLHDLWHPEKIIYFIAATFMQGLAIIGGLILLIIPGIIFGLMFYFAGYLVMDKNLGPVEAIRESARITNGHKWELFLLGVASIGITIIGFICLIVGVLVALPVVSLAFVHAYRQLQNKAALMPAAAPVA